MVKFRYKDLFKHKERICLIVERERQLEDDYNPLRLMSAMLFNNPFTKTYCAYVESKEVPLEIYDFHGEIEKEYITFAGQFSERQAGNILKKHPDKQNSFWIGFDTGLRHETKSTNTYKAVRKRLKELCEELIKKGY